MARSRRSRLFRQGRRYYGDFRDFADVGGRKEALRAEGQTWATDDPAIARVLVDRRLRELQALRRQRTILGETPATSTLEAYVRHHLEEKARSGHHPTRYLEDLELQLARACLFFGRGRPLMGVQVTDVKEWAVHLRRTLGTGKSVSESRIRAHLMALSNLYTRAKSEAAVVGSYNPVANIMRGEKPQAARREADFLEHHEAAALLEAARTIAPGRSDLACSFLLELVATLLLTGGRRAEVLGLEADDVSFQRKTITFRPNGWRRLKTPKSHRVVPLWPQLEELLGPYIVPVDRPPRAGLLFPTRDRTGQVTMVRDFRKALGAAAAAAGLDPKRVTPKVLRHTYCSARLQSLDGGKPVSPFTVQREMGHASPAMVSQVYGHLGTVRYRGEGVEYRMAEGPAEKGSGSVTGA